MLLQVVEHQAIRKEQISKDLLLALQLFDERHAKLHDGETIFDWRLREIRAKNWVGVVSIPGLTVEIAPKIADGADNRDICQENLIYMLCYSGTLPFSERDVAKLRFEKSSLLEAFISLLAESMLSEIRRGVDRGYIPIEEESVFAKGKINVSKSIRSGRQIGGRLTVSYDSFVIDTTINRILKLSCRFILQRTKLSLTQQKLREVALMLGDVEDVTLQSIDFDRIIYNRSNSRYRPIIEICRQLLSYLNPNLAAGNAQAFSLLFPMEQVFESFIAAYIRRNADRLGLKGKRILAQDASSDRHLLIRILADGKHKPCVRIRPDIVVENQDGKPHFIIDTKWKKLDPDTVNSRNSISMSDLYQVYSYAHHFSCPKNILLYPARKGVSDKKYALNSHPDKFLYTRQIDLDFRLITDSELLLSNVSRAIDLA